MYVAKVRIILKSVTYLLTWNNIQYRIHVTHFQMEILRN